MGTHVADAVGELVKLQTLRVHYLPGDPDRWYTVKAPCLLAQLVGSFAQPTGGAGGRSVARSRLPLSAAALDLWMEITGNVHGWAESLGVDRKPYRDAERHAMSRLTRHLDDVHPFADRTVPPIGRMLRAVAAQSVALGREEEAERIAFKATVWAERIRVMLAGPAPDERVHSLRGQACGVCGAARALETREGERFWVPAVQVRFLAMDESLDLWPYRICLACGDNGWIPYSTETPAA